MRWLDLKTYACPKNVGVFVAWLDQFGNQATFVAQWNGTAWFSNGRQIADPTHFARIPPLPVPPARSNW